LPSAPDALEFQAQGAQPRRPGRHLDRAQGFQRLGISPGIGDRRVAAQARRELDSGIDRQLGEAALDALVGVAETLL